MNTIPIIGALNRIDEMQRRGWRVVIHVAGDSIVVSAFDGTRQRYASGVGQFAKTFSDIVFDVYGQEGEPCDAECVTETASSSIST